MRHNRSTPPDVRRAALCAVLVTAIACLAGCGADTKGTSRSNRRASATTSPAAAGRAPQAGPPSKSGRITNTDPCAMRLHDISGALLLYYARNNDLPPTLGDLEGVPGIDGPATFECPVSKTPYLYNPTGIYLAERSTYLVVYDPQPSHQGHRWAVTVEQPQPGVPLVTKVIALPESFFALRPPR
jgi:hypothetical protein